MIFLRFGNVSNPTPIPPSPAASASPLRHRPACSQRPVGASLLRGQDGNALGPATPRAQPCFPEQPDHRVSACSLATVDDDMSSLNLAAVLHIWKEQLPLLCL